MNENSTIHRLIPLACLSTLFICLPHLATGQVNQDNIYDPGILKPTDSNLKVAIHAPAPNFTLPSLKGGKTTLSQYREKKNVVLSFVPAAWTPVCSAQWPGYHLAKEYFDETDTILIGITVDNIPTLHAWTKEMGGLWFEVLSDFYPHGEVAGNYGILRRSGVSERALFLIDKKGIIQWIDIHDINKRPPLDDLVKAMRAIKKD
ncbi:MAG: redoxin domain-containing protein [Verrucomicrobia bacterium]|nr:redoxin domain-containing protein [Verrucomicrobiota bacterium]